MTATSRTPPPPTVASSQHARTVAEQEPWWEPAYEAGADAPNMLVIILDDAGWSDLGCFGSEIVTPSIDRLASEGLRYNNFHVTPLCSPTRACLLSGRNHHSVGMRFLADTDTGYANSRGRVDPEIPLLPEQLRRAGYGTYLAGKWHLAPLHEITPAGPFHNWPLARGFNRFYGFLDGCTDQISPELYEDNHPVEPPKRDGYHLSEDLAEHAIGFIRDHRAFRPDHPFYLQMALGAVHAPFQVPRRYIDKYVDVFTKGWDRTRTDRLRRQIESGLCPPGTVLTQRNPGVPAWDELDLPERQLYAHLQAAFAGFLEHADEQIGRVIDALGDLGILEDTVIVVMSDNGASREGGPHGAVNTNSVYSGAGESIAQNLSKLDRLGGADGPAHYPEGWAMAGNTPFRRYKQFVDLGGVRSPLIIRYPAAVRTPGAVRRPFVHIVDIAPTLLELAGIKPAMPLHGASIAATLADPDSTETRDTQYFEMLGHRAIWHQGWAAVTQHTGGDSYDDDRWRLYDTATDFSEATDVADQHPDRLAALIELWEREAEANGVFPLDDRSLVQLLRLRTEQGLMGRSTITLQPGNSHVPAASTVTGTDRSLLVTARLFPDAAHTGGVILASGNSAGGYVFYLQNGTLTFEHHFLEDRVICRATRPLPARDVNAGFRISRREDRSARVTMFVDADTVGSVELPMTSVHLGFYGMDAGHDPVSQVSNSYQGESAMAPGCLRDVTLEFLAEPNVAELAESIEGTE